MGQLWTGFLSNAPKLNKQKETRNQLPKNRKLRIQLPIMRQSMVLNVTEPLSILAVQPSKARVMGVCQLMMQRRFLQRWPTDPRSLARRDGPCATALPNSIGQSPQLTGSSMPWRKCLKRRDLH